MSSKPADHYIPSTPETVVRGYLSPFVNPVLRINSGETVQIDTVTTAGIPLENPISFFEEHDIPVIDSVKDTLDIMEKVEFEGPHVLTGPIYLQDAQPGDMIEIRILELAPRSPYYGVNLTMPNRGSLGHIVSEPWSRVIHYDLERNIGIFNDNIDILLAPFMGVMGLSPTKKVSSLPPGRFGGNLDLKHLTAGTSLFLPVEVDGGLFYTGDAHGAQGNGEVNVTAIETSMTGKFQFILHKNKILKFPRAETASHYIVMGLDEDLDKAAEIAVQESIDFLSWKMNITPLESYSLTSIAVDLEVTQIVDGVKGVHCMIPKSIFKNLQDMFWTQK